MYYPLVEAVSKKKKVLFAINCLNIGGAPSVLLSHVEHIDKSRFEPWVVTLYPSKPANFLCDIERFVGKERVVSFNLYRRSIFDLKTLFRIFQLLRRENFDTVVTHLFLANTIVRFLARLARVPRIISFEHSVYTQKRAWQRRVDWYLARGTYRIVVPHQEVASFTARQEGIPISRFIVIPNMPRIVRRDEVILSRLREEWAVPKPPLFVSIGRFSEEKGHAVFVRALKQVVDSGIPCGGLIIGHGAKRDELQRLVRDLKMDAYCKIIEDPVHAQYGYYMADVFVLPSVREGFSLVAAEAMLAHLPIIASDLPVLRDFVTPENGVLVDACTVDEFVQAISTLASDEGLRDRMSKASAMLAVRVRGHDPIQLLENLL